MKSLPAFVWLLCLACRVVAAESLTATPGIERLDPALDELIAPEAQVEKVAEGFAWAEGPVWFQGGLLFSDVPRNTVYRWNAQTRKVEVFLRPSGLLNTAAGFREPGSNGLAVDAQGRLLLCQHGERRVARLENGTFTTVVDRYEGKRFNTPNDLVVVANGDIYFTDPVYGFKGLEGSPLRELSVLGVYRVTTRGEVTQLISNLTAPNGIALSPDEQTLYVGVSDTKVPCVMAYDLQPDGSVVNGRIFFDARSVARADREGFCDGLKVDRSGNVWATGPGGVWIISSAGKVLGLVRTGKPTANCGWGEDGGTLFITAQKYVFRLKTKTKGAGW